MDEIWCWTYGWLTPRRIDDDQSEIAQFAGLEENQHYFLFFAQLVMAEV